MATTHHAGGTAQNAGVKTVTMPFSEDDLREARIKRLAEIRDECERVRGKLVPLKEVAELVKSTTEMLNKICKSHGIKTTFCNRPEYGNRKYTCVSEPDAERVIKLMYE